MHSAFSFFRPSPEERARLDELADGAVIAWMEPVPSEEKLAAYLATVEASHRKRTERTARRAVRDFDRIIADGPGGIPLDDHIAHFRLRLEAKHPWLSAHAHERLSFYAHWMNWHG